MTLTQNDSAVLGLTYLLDPSPAGAMAHFIRRLRVSRAERQRRAQIVRELDSFNDRELRDLGFNRADFPAIMSGTYRR